MKTNILAACAAILFLASCDTKDSSAEAAPKKAPENPELVILPNAEPKPFHSSAVDYFRKNRLIVSEKVKLSDDVEKQIMDKIEEIIMTGSQIGDVRVDFILMQHNSFLNPVGYDDESRFSQQKVYDLLAEKGYDLIGFEGSALEDLTIDGLNEEVDKDMRQLNFPDAEKLVTVFDRKFPTIVREDGVLRFMKDHPNTVHVAGTEMYPINIVGELQAYFAHDTMSDRAVNLMDLRSEMALARTLIIAKRSGFARTCVVIGASHGAHLSKLARVWACGGAFYRALTEEGKRNKFHTLDPD